MCIKCRKILNFESFQVNKINKRDGSLNILVDREADIRE